MCKGHRMSRALLAVEPLLVGWDRCFAEMSINIFIVVTIIITLIIMTIKIGCSLR